MIEHDADSWEHRYCGKGLELNGVLVSKAMIWILGNSSHSCM